MKLSRASADLLIAGAALLCSYLFSKYELFIPSGLIIIIASLGLSLRSFSLSKSLIDPVALFTLSWLGGMGLSALKLSYLEVSWSALSWLSFYGAYAAFYLGFNLYMRRHPVYMSDPVETPPAAYEGILKAANIIMIISTASLILEAALIGYIPLFTIDTPHAYSYFHVSGLHYFTVSFVPVPALIVIYLRAKGPFSRLKVPLRLDIILLLMLSLIYPLLMVSRFQLIFEIVIAFAAYLAISPAISRRGALRKSAVGILGFALIVMLYIFISIERSHSGEYLMGIFEMKYDIPLFIAQPYIYIANNYDNFNALTVSLTHHTLGLRMLFPLFALTGLKFVFPSLTSSPLFVTKEELTTLSFIYDAYYDFGLIGVIGLSLIIGVLMAFLYLRVRHDGLKRPLHVLLYSELLFYIIFSFFTTWFSNAATWFYFAEIMAVWIFLKIYKRR